MKRILLALALLLIPSLASAQCTGVFGAYSVCGNPTGSPTTPRAAAITSFPFGLTQGSVVFAGPGGILSQDNTNFFWDNTYKALGIGFNTPNAVTNGTGLAVAGFTRLSTPSGVGITYPPLLLSVTGGFTGGPMTSYAGPMAGFSQVSQVTTNGGDGSEQATVQINLNANSSPTVVGAVSQAVGLAVKADMAATGKADIAPAYFIGTNNSTEICESLCRTAFGMFAGTFALGPHISGIPLQVGVWNGNGVDRPFNSAYNGGQTIMVALDANYQATSGSWLGSAVVQSRATPATGQWDTLIGATTGSIANSIVRDYSGAVTSWDDRSAHTNGWYCNTGCSYSNYSLFLPGFNLTGTGHATFTDTTSPQVAITNGAHTAIWGMPAGGTLQFGTTTVDNIQFIAANTGIGSATTGGSWTFNTDITTPIAKLSAVADQLVFQSAGVTGTISWAPSTSNKKITLPNGTTDFTGTGGASQVVKQTTSGGAFSVARLACADLSDSASGCSTAAGVSSITPGNGLTSTLTATAPGSAITTTGTLSSAHLVNAQTGTSYAIADSDRAKTITAVNASAQAYSIAQAGAASAFQSGWYTDIKNNSTNPAGIVTITPTTSTINGASTFVLQPGRSVRVISDGSNYQAMFTATAAQLPGTTTNDAANIGNIGEYVSSTGSSVALTISGTTYNCASISLTAGDWDVTYKSYYSGAAGTTLADIASTISQTSATFNGTLGAWAANFYSSAVVGSNTVSLHVGPYRQSLSGTTTIYGTASAGFGASTESVSCLLSARRVR